MKKWFLYILFLILTKYGSSQPHAAFETDVTQGCAPLVVTSNLSTPQDNASYIWDFGNGNTSSLKNPQASYTAKGQYTVSLVVATPEGQDTLVRKNLIQVFGEPTANYLLTTKHEGCVPIEVGFKNASEKADGEIVQWIWDFGDGQTGNASTPTHKYSKGGAFPCVVTGN